MCLFLWITFNTAKAFILTRYGKNIKLSGLLYFHEISDTQTGHRMAGTPSKNLGMFEELCGENAPPKVILTTTMWDVVDRETGVERERKLMSSYWRPMVLRGSLTERFVRTRESAFTVIDPLIETANMLISDQLQQELVDMRRNLSSTSRAAGQGLYSTMGQFVSQREDLLRRIRNEIKCGASNEKILELLQDEYQLLKINMESTINEMRRLRIPLGKRVVKMTDKFFSSNFTFKLFKVTSVVPSLNLAGCDVP
jgi:hypothetical protein